MTIAVVVGRRLATMHELQTVYGLQTLYDLLEIAGVDTENERIAHERSNPT